MMLPYYKKEKKSDYIFKNLYICLKKHWEDTQETNKWSYLLREEYVVLIFKLYE